MFDRCLAIVTLVVNNSFPCDMGLLIESSLRRQAWLGSADLGAQREHPMEFGMFHEFPSLPGRTESEAFDEAMEQVEAAAGARCDVAGRTPFRAAAVGTVGAA